MVPQTCNGFCVTAYCAIMGCKPAKGEKIETPVICCFGTPSQRTSCIIPKRAGPSKAHVFGDTRIPISLPASEIVRRLGKYHTERTFDSAILYNQILHRISELNLLPGYSTTMTAISAMEFVHYACDLDATLISQGRNPLMMAEAGFNDLHRCRWKLADLFEPFGMDFESEFWQDELDVPSADGKKKHALRQAEETEMQSLAKRRRSPPGKSKLSVVSIADIGVTGKARRKGWLTGFRRLVLATEWKM